jgi:heptosyltransferase-3
LQRTARRETRALSNDRDMANLVLPERPKILVITLRRLGDVLLTTPLLRTLRTRWPGATLDALVFRGSDRILKGNPDIDRVLTMAEGPSARESLALIGQIWRGYDLAISTQAGDRPTFYACVAGRSRLGLLPFPGRDGAWWKRFAHHVGVQADPEMHRIEELRQFARALGIASWSDLVCPIGGSADAIAPTGPYAVLHASPMYRYKRWSDEGWRALARGLVERRLSVVTTEGRDPAERAYVDALWDSADVPVVRERGRLDWAGLTALLESASVYVGPDTSMTHLAAGSGCPTVALYGPTRPKLIGPWPVGGLAQPWNDIGTIQRQGNVWLVQNPLPCMPCDQLGCERHLESHSQCLDELSPRQVLVAVDQALAAGRHAGLQAAKGGAAGQTPVSKSLLQQQT